MKILSWFSVMMLAMNFATQAQAQGRDVAAGSVPVNNIQQPLTPTPILPSGATASVVTSVNSNWRDVNLPFTTIAPAPGSMSLNGVRSFGQVEFGVRSDQLVTQATLNLEFTPSPSLIPVQSQIQVYLNDQLMAVTSIEKEQLGKVNTLHFALDPHYVTDFNRLRIQFIGHYQLICENPTNNTIWLNIGKGSSLSLRYQQLPVENELSHFPEPFFDARDSNSLVLPMVFADVPDSGQQQAAAILASWFGAKAQWRGQSFPTLYNQLPDRHGIVFATNTKRPDFLNSLPAFTGPQIEIISHPQNPYIKLLVIEGRDDADLLTAVKGIAQGDVLFRGQTVAINQIQQLKPRQPYDAPNWVRTDRPMTFGELKQYPGQLQTEGLQPEPVWLTVNVPPDLFLVNSNNNGIGMKLKYRYTSPSLPNSSRLRVSLNNLFVQDFVLMPGKDENSQMMHFPILQGLLDDHRDMVIPALHLGAVNRISFNFDYTTLLETGMENRCENYSIVNNHAIVDDDSTIDFTGYRHFLAMPDLRAYIHAGFPFSRMADLSQTLVLMPKQPQAEQVTTLLDAVGNLGSITGYPALAVKVTDDESDIAKRDTDVLIIGNVPVSLNGQIVATGKQANLLLDSTRDWVKKPQQQSQLPVAGLVTNDQQAESQADISAHGAIAAVIGLQSPYFEQRSIVALLAQNTKSAGLLNEVLQSPAQHDGVFGSVAVIRNSGVTSLQVGDSYYVGHLPWWERVWNLFAPHPILLAAIALISVLFATLVIWNGLRMLARRRLNDQD
jgi:hypothetical protein